MLVTGATGLLGGWLVRRLVANKALAVTLVRDWVPQSDLLSGSMMSHVALVRGDMRDQQVLERLLGEYECETIFHLAAQTIVGVANRSSVETLDTNIRGTWAVLEAARRSPLVRSIVTASSDKAYGDHDVLPYDVSKSCADLIARMYAKTFDLPVAITRCGNFYGGGDLNCLSRAQSGGAVLRGEPPVIRSDGSLIRDYF